MTPELTDDEGFEYQAQQGHFLVWVLKPLWNSKWALMKAMIWQFVKNIIDDFFSLSLNGSEMIMMADF